MNFSNNKTPQNQSQTEKVVKSWSNPEIISKKIPYLQGCFKNCEFIAYDGTLLPDEDGLD